MEVGELEGTGEGEDEGYVVIVRRGRSCSGWCLGRRGRMGGNAAGQRGVVVDVEFEEVE